MEIGQSSFPRRPTRQIKVGDVAVGGGAPVSVQSMTVTKTADVEATLQQIYALAAAGCDIERFADSAPEAPLGGWFDVEAAQEEFLPPVAVSSD